MSLFMLLFAFYALIGYVFAWLTRIRPLRQQRECLLEWNADLRKTNALLSEEAREQAAFRRQYDAVAASLQSLAVRCASLAAENSRLKILAGEAPTRHPTVPPEQLN